MGDELTEVAKHRHTEPAALGKLIRGDLDWIVMKGLEKTRPRRTPVNASGADRA